MDTLKNIKKDKALSFFQEIAIPTVAEFLNKPDDKRLGCLACLCLSHMADHVFHAWKEIKRNPSCRTITDYRSYLMDENFALKQIFDVANATKHVLRKQGVKSNAPRVGFEDIQTQAITIRNLRCNWPINGNHVMVEVRDDELWLLSDLVKLVKVFWIEKLTERGLSIKGYKN